MKNSGVLSAYNDKMQYTSTADSGSLYSETTPPATNTPRGSYLLHNSGWAFSGNPQHFTSNMYFFFWDYGDGHWKCNHWFQVMTRDPILEISAADRCNAGYYSDGGLHDRSTNTMPCRAERVEGCVWRFNS